MHGGKGSRLKNFSQLTKFRVPLLSLLLDFFKFFCKIWNIVPLEAKSSDSDSVEVFHYKIRTFVFVHPIVRVNFAKFLEK